MDTKQSEWTKIEQTGHKKRNVSINEDIYSQTQNWLSFKHSLMKIFQTMLHVSNMNQVVDGVDSQLSDYRAKQQAKFKNSNTSKKNQIHSSKAKDTRQNPEMPGKSSMKNGCDLVIGDSMVKNIDSKKLTRAAKRKAVCHSYSGATVKQINEKLEERLKEDHYDKIIIHVGTNDLARAPRTTDIKSMETLITKVKGQASEVAVSSVVRRYDNKVRLNTITYYNNLLHQLCIDHKIAYINND